MLGTPGFDLQTNTSTLQNILDQPEQPYLRRVTSLVEHLYRVPVAYIALVDNGLSVATRIGSGSEYWEFLKSYPFSGLIAAPEVVKDAERDLPPGASFGEIRFAASVPLRTSAGLELGILVIADRQPRPDFSDQDLQALATLAEVLAAKMELRMVAAQAVETELALREAEGRFRMMANAASVLIIYGGPDGSCSFVNKTWLEFTGRCFEESLGDDWAEDVHPEDRSAVIETYWNAFQTRQPFTSGWRMRRHDGNYRWMLGRGTPCLREDGTFAGFVGVFVDDEDHLQKSASFKTSSTKMKS